MQTIVTTITLYSTLISSVPCIPSSMILGSWSDKHGRKPILILPIIGSLLCQVAYLLNVFFKTILAVNLYIAATTSESSRTERIAVMHDITTKGYTLENILAPYIYQSWEYFGTFGLTAAVLGLTLFLTILCSLFWLSLLSLKLDVPDSDVCLPAIISKLTDMIVTSLANTGNEYIFAKCLGIMSELSSMAIRSQM